MQHGQILRNRCLPFAMPALYLAKEVAAILREILTHPTKKLYGDRTAHLLCSNPVTLLAQAFWLKAVSVQDSGT